MDEKYIKAFNAVITFVHDIWDVFGNPKKATPLALYRRLIEHIKFADSDAINKVLNGFKEFFSMYEKSILSNNLDSIPRGVVIRYGESKSVYLDIQKYIYQTQKDPETRAAIRQHLVTISAILDPDSKKLEELDKRINELNIDLDSKEGEFITGIMHKAKSSMENVDTENPGQAIMGLLSSGVIQEMVSGLQYGVSSGEMDMQKLLGSMQTAIGSIMPPPTQSTRNTQKSEISEKGIKEIKDEID
jgi:hypothetical protein